MASKVTPSAVKRRISPAPKPPMVPNKTGQMTKPVPAGYYRPTAGQTVGQITKKYGLTAQQLATLNPGYKMSAGFGANANPLKVRGYAKPLPGAPKVTPTQPAPNPTPAGPMTTDQWLGQDTDYQDYLSKAGYNQASFLSDLTSKRNTAATTQAEALRTLALQDPKNRESQSEDYAARGMSQSGVYANALQNLSSQYAQKQGDIGRAYTDTTAGYDQDVQGYNQDAANLLTEAQKAALRRRAAKYGLES